MAGRFRTARHPSECTPTVVVSDRPWVYGGRVRIQFRCRDGTCSVRCSAVEPRLCCSVMELSGQRTPHVASLRDHSHHPGGRCANRPQELNLQAPTTYRTPFRTPFRTWMRLRRLRTPRTLTDAPRATCLSPSHTCLLGGVREHPFIFHTLSLCPALSCLDASCGTVMGRKWNTSGTERERPGIQSDDGP